MTRFRLVSVTTLFLGVGLAATAANADDEIKVDVTTGAAADDVADDDVCVTECNSQCASAKAQGKILQFSYSGDQPLVEGVSPEERARAAEQFEAAMERMRADHRTELERVRLEERDNAAKKYEADINAARTDERARYAAQVRTEETPDVIEDAALTPVGVYGSLGGGASDFIESRPLGATGTGGYWDARLGIGTRSIIGAEVAYVGGLHDINALGLNDDAFLMHNGLEGVARLNAPITSEDAPVLFEPYAFGGIGYQHYTVANDTVNTSDIRGDDDIMVVPVGVGLALGFSGVTLDTRATYRHTYFTDLFGETTNSFDSTSMSNWGVGAALGFEF